MDNSTETKMSPELLAFATRMYDAARHGQLDLFQQALPAGLPANMTNDKGDSLVRHSSTSQDTCLCFALTPIDR